MQTEQTAQTERIFDEGGVTVGENTASPGTQPPAETPASPAAAAETPKFRIGDREFTTQADALEYAQRQVEVADAYRQGITDAGPQAAQQQQSVTPAAPPLNPEELYTNPQSFLDKYAQRIKAETTAAIDQRTAVQRESDRIWHEFGNRHPDLADFRAEVEEFVNKNQPQVRGLVQARGFDASFDFIATKLKAQFENYSNALKKKRDLPNVATTTLPADRQAAVTPQADPKKALSFSDQIRNLRKRKRA